MHLKTRIPAIAILILVLLLAPLCLAQSTAVPSYVVSTIVGCNPADPTCTAGGEGYTGDGGPATAAQLAGPVGLAIDPSGNIFIADQFNDVIREVTTDGNINTVAGDHIGSYTGDGGPAISADINNATGVALDSSNNVYIADIGSDVIRKFTVGGNISTYAGSNSLYFVTGSAVGGFSGDGGPATNALLNLPYAIAIAPNGDLYIADTQNNRVRKVTASTGDITTIAGDGTQGFAGDGGAATAAHLFFPRGVAVDASGNVYIADTGNNKIRKVSGGAITTVAGIQSVTGEGGFSGDGGPAIAAQLNQPRGIALDSAGNLYIADYNNQRIRMITSTGIIWTIAGTGDWGYSGDGGPATSAQFYFPSGVALDSSGNVYVADTDNDVVRLLTPSAAPGGGGLPPTITSAIGASGFGGGTSVAPGSWIEIYGSNLAPPGDSRSWTYADFNGPNAPTTLDRTSVSIGGEAAFVEYISPGQINAEVPATTGLGLGPQPVTVSTAYGVSAPVTLTVNLTQPELLAPASFNIGGVPYVMATFTDLVTFVAPVGSIPGYSSRPATPGETIVLYGIGFGGVTGYSGVPGVSENLPAGQVVEQANSLITPVQFLFNNTPAPQPLNYAGLAPGEVGLYQFNITVPALAAGGAVPLTFTQGNTSSNQTVYVAVQN